MKEAVTKVIDTLTQEDFHGAFQKLFERYNKSIAAGGDYYEGDKSFIRVIIIIIIISCWQHGYPWPSLATPPYRSSP